MIRAFRTGGPLELPERLDAGPATFPAGAIHAFLVIRNEADRLPFLLTYYRRLGVDRFFVTDNGSTDGSLAFLLAQPDCVTFRTTASFAEAGCGMDWINAMVEAHGAGNWCLFVDADELLTFPHAEEIGLGAFCDHLDATGAEAVFALMVDMYGEGPVAGARYRRGQSFLETCPLFDADYRLRLKAVLPFTAPFLPVEAIGGPRHRLFYPAHGRRSPSAALVDRGMRWLRAGPLAPLWRALGLSGGASALPPDITKVPLMKGKPGRGWMTNHRTVPLPLSPVRAALLHFKFFAAFDEQAKREAARGEHWDGGSEYRRYVDWLAAHPDCSFRGPSTRRYTGSDDLLSAGILASTPALDALAEEMAARKAAQGAACGAVGADSQAAAMAATRAATRAVS